MRHAAFLFVTTFCLGFGCGPAKPTPSKEVHLVGVEDLCRCYRTNPKDKTFTGCLVQCVLEPHTYRFRVNAIEAHWFADTMPGCVVFECFWLPPPDPSKRLVVTGRCSGIVRDGIRREASTDFYVLVAECSVTVLDP